MPVADDEWHRVPFVDGIWPARDLVVLICRSVERIVSWYMARSRLQSGVEPYGLAGEHE